MSNHRSIAISALPVAEDTGLPRELAGPSKRRKVVELNTMLDTEMLDVLEGE